MGGAGTAVVEGQKPGQRLIDGIRFRVRTGVPWRGLPAGQVSWGRAYGVFRRWRRDGTWHRSCTALRAPGPGPTRKSGSPEASASTPRYGGPTSTTPRDAANSQSGTRRPSLSRPSASGCDQSHGTLHTHQLISPVP
ncbi:transposase [Streptomyces sp. M19]